MGVAGGSTADAPRLVAGDSTADAPDDAPTAGTSDFLTFWFAHVLEETHGFPMPCPNSSQLAKEGAGISNYRKSDGRGSRCRRTANGARKAFPRGTRSVPYARGAPTYRGTSRIRNLHRS